MSDSKKKPTAGKGLLGDVGKKAPIKRDNYKKHPNDNGLRDLPMSAYAFRPTYEPTYAAKEPQKPVKEEAAADEAKTADSSETVSLTGSGENKNSGNFTAIKNKKKIEPTDDPLAQDPVSRTGAEETSSSEFKPAKKAAKKADDAALASEKVSWKSDSSASQFDFASSKAEPETSICDEAVAISHDENDQASSEIAEEKITGEHKSSSDFAPASSANRRESLFKTKKDENPLADAVREAQRKRSIEESMAPKKKTWIVPVAIAAVAAIGAAGAWGWTAYKAKADLAACLSGDETKFSSDAALFAACQRAGDRGHVASAKKVADYYLADSNNSEAYPWVVRCAAGGNADCAFRLGMYFSEGIKDTLKPKADKALAWMNSASDAGHSQAMYELSRAYAKGSDKLGVKKDLDKSKSYLEKSASLGNADALFRMALNLQSGGEGQIFDGTESVEYLKKAAEAGSAEAMYDLAVHYLLADNNRDKFIELMEKSLASGNPGAGITLAITTLGEVNRINEKESAENAAKARKLRAEVIRYADEVLSMKPNDRFSKNNLKNIYEEYAYVSAALAIKAEAQLPDNRSEAKKNIAAAMLETPLSAYACMTAQLAVYTGSIEDSDLPREVLWRPEDEASKELSQKFAQNPPNQLASVTALRSCANSLDPKLHDNTVSTVNAKILSAFESSGALEISKNGTPEYPNILAEHCQRARHSYLIKQDATNADHLLACYSSSEGDHLQEALDIVFDSLGGNDPGFAMRTIAVFSGLAGFPNTVYGHDVKDDAYSRNIAGGFIAALAYRGRHDTLALIAKNMDEDYEGGNPHALMAINNYLSLLDEIIVDENGNFPLGISVNLFHIYNALRYKYQLSEKTAPRIKENLITEGRLFRSAWAYETLARDALFSGKNAIYKTKDPSQAIIWARELLAIDPDHCFANFVLASAHGFALPKSERNYQVGISAARHMISANCPLGHDIAAQNFYAEPGVPAEELEKIPLEEKCLSIKIAESRIDPKARLSADDRQIMAKLIAAGKKCTKMLKAEDNAKLDSEAEAFLIKEQEEEKLRKQQK